MKETVTINIENLSEKEYVRFKNLVAKGNKAKKRNKERNKVWKPENTEPFYYIGNNRKIYNGWYDENNTSDKEQYSIGNCFRTKKEAEFIAEKFRVITELQKIAKENNSKIKWNNLNEKKYFLLYDYKYKIVTINYTHTNYKFSTIYFSSIEAAKKAVETIGEQRIKKYYLEVE